jgi:hypothetical protein
MADTVAKVGEVAGDDLDRAWVIEGESPVCICVLG